ncbi:hypothetical protein [Clostridium gasigenes]|uniref:Methyltransferase domain-containing protein n=1 Tax=Clostridium gasigenes TaxID=94869 RepID=A0A7X0SBB9_9CLOT|nr:hypothetical protein [Clostridium gasigenes]MBB6714409.1 hypothetical protein [Clostridium gasigenes]
MITYKQDVKEKSREILWEHAIFSLTAQRNNVKILNEQYIIKIWDYIYNNCKYTKNNSVFKEPNIDYLNKWCDFSESTYENKRASDLKIIYLCGPEPENDIDVILKYGIRVENIWAIESDAKSYNKALENARVKYPMLKIYKGKINEFLKTYPLKFDIIYLDFTKSLLTEFQIIHNIFDNQSLAQLGVLIVNTTLPDANDENINFLSKFFIDQNRVEGKVLGLKNEDREVTWFADSSRCYGYCEPGDLKDVVAENFTSAYSSFSSLYPMIYASSISPLYRITKSEILYNKIFLEKDLLNIEMNKIYSNEYIDFVNHSEYGFVKLMSKNNGIERSWKNYYDNKENSILNRTEISKLTSLIRMGLCRETSKIYNEKFLKSTLNTYKIMDKIEKSRFFTDILFPNILIEMFINQIGFTYHPIINNHKRISYTAKTRTMYTDIFTFDQCRSFYDWMPMIEFYDASVDICEKQMLIRSFLDAIGGKQYGTTPIATYGSGSSIISFGEREWAKFVDRFPERIDLNTIKEYE